MHVPKRFKQDRTLYGDLPRLKSKNIGEAQGVSEGGRTFPSRVGARKGAEAIRNPCPQGFSLLRQFWRKLYRPLNRAPYAPRLGGARFARSSFLKETLRAGSAMFGRGGKKTRTRIEPRRDARAGGAAGGDLRADPAARPPTSSRRKKNAPSRASSSSKRGRRRRSLIGHLAYWGLVLSVWGAIVLAGLFAYYASQLPPTLQLAAPKPP